MNLGKKIKELRLQRGLSAKELSETSGVTRSLISELETGKRFSTSVDTIARLAKALHVSPSYFFGPEYPSSPETIRTVPGEMREFLLQETSHSYVRLAKKAQELGLPPDLLEELFELIIKIRSSSPHQPYRKS
ncbi:MAG: helix-turn-helix transcriptional regulator [Desulfitobacterium hafniense]|nr:helix-turn-helix transcriptional regulator [Desulfitobacterium hafniense]